MGQKYCYGCGGHLVHRRSEGHSSYRCRRCRVSIWSENGKPIGVSPWEGERYAKLLSQAKDVCIGYLHWLGLASDKEVALTGMILEADDLIELGDVRRLLRLEPKVA